MSRTVPQNEVSQNPEGWKSVLRGLAIDATVAPSPATITVTFSAPVLTADPTPKPVSLSGLPVCEISAIDTTNLELDEFPIDFMKCSIYMKRIFYDKASGQSVSMVRYPAGVCDPWHVHLCSHSIYVLEGTLKTHQGQYRPGSFNTFPAQTMMTHGATGKDDCVALLITNSDFAIHFVGDENDAEAPGFEHLTGGMDRISDTPKRRTMAQYSIYF
ncbi:RmlC-like cupin domain-containing protein [Aspergillus karnatakaensis]|uniref:cupin domain-containing protein n=1 Tax=Aspergillus karnatakaensis TaxID=1810916 RepID=UPI003CCD7548